MAAIATEKTRRAEIALREDLDVEMALCARDILHWFDRYLWTYDPRLVGRSGGAYVPFKLWPKQRDIVLWMLERLRAAEEGLIEKSRDTGVTYLCAAVALHQWLFAPGFKATFGSRKVDYVDKKDNPDSIFAKLRIMLRRLPATMLPEGFSWSQHDHYMRLVNPQTGAVISGEGGDDMGRGGRSSVYFVDEAAFIVGQYRLRDLGVVGQRHGQSLCP
jgi:phage terminase large subunit